MKQLRKIMAFAAERLQQVGVGRGACTGFPVGHGKEVGRRLKMLRLDPGGDAQVVIVSGRCRVRSREQ